MHKSLTARVVECVDGQSPLAKQWEALVKGNTASGIMQSLHWRDVKVCQGMVPLHVCVFSGDVVVAGAIFYTSFKRSGVGVLVAPEGPVLPWHDEELARDALRLIIGLAREHAEELGVMALRIEPRIEPPPPRCLREFSRGPVDLVPYETLYIDLTLDVRELLASMRPKGRYNIRLAEKHDVKVIQENSPETVAKFYSVMEQVAARDGFAVEPRIFFERLASKLCDRGCLRFFYAEHEGDLLGTLMMTVYGSRATYLYGGTTDIKRNLMGGYALQWAAMTAAKDEGCSTYDFYGFDAFRSAEHQYAKFSQFKSQFGGAPMRFVGAQELFFTDKVADAFVRLANEANSVENTESTYSFAGAE
jgi:peptidoglycan pentaglycine glycine transferase (the first glycine)